MLVHLMLELYGCNRELLSNEAVVRRALDEYPARVGMEKVSPVHLYNIETSNPLDAGLSGFVVIAQSHISMHAWPEYGAPDAPYCEPSTARVTIIPAPLEYSLCYMKGTEHGPQAILDASSQMELYDEELDCCPIEVGIYTRPALDYRGMDHATALKATGDAVREVLERGQLPFTLGGEHSLSAPPIAAVRDYFPDLTVVHIDAHGDLRNEYEGTPLSHAAIERRVVDMGIPLTEIGIRSFSPEEAEFMKTCPNVAVGWGYQFANGAAVIPWDRLSQH